LPLPAWPAPGHRLMSVTISIKSITTEVPEGGTFRIVLEAVRVGALAEAAFVQIELNALVFNDNTAAALIAAGFSRNGNLFTTFSIPFSTLSTTETKTLSIAIPQDTIFGLDQQFDLRLVNPLNATIGTPGSTRITIIDDDVGVQILPVFSLETAVTSVGEEDGEIIIFVTRSFPEGSDPNVTSTVVFATFPGPPGSGAVEGFDYGGPGFLAVQPLVFSPGQLIKIISIPIIDNAFDDDDQFFLVLLSGETNATLGTAGVVITIIDDEEDPSDPIIVPPDSDDLLTIFIGADRIDALTDFRLDPINSLRALSRELFFDFLSGDVIEGTTSQPTQQFLDDFAGRLNVVVDAVGQAFLNSIGVARDFQQSLASVAQVKSALETLTQNAMQTSFDIMQGIITGTMTQEEANARLDQLISGSQTELKNALENITAPDFSVTLAFGGFQFVVDFLRSENANTEKQVTARFSIGHGNQQLIENNDNRMIVIGSLLDDDIITGDGDDVVSGGYGNNNIHTGIGNDVVHAGPGNDRIDGGPGGDLMSGGDGDDTYVVDNADDLVLELVGFGTDTIESSIFFTLPDNVENLTLTGSDSLDGVGNSLDNVLTGNLGNNTLSGNAGDDILEGGAGADVLDGGSGNNTGSYAHSPAAVSVDLTTGIGLFGDAQGDTLINIINLIGSPGGDSLLGTGITNGIDGGLGNDLLRGRGGDDTLDGGLGLDVAQYAASRSLLTVTNNNNGSFTVDAVLSGEGTDQVIDIERLQLSDGVIALDLAGNAGQTYRLYQASFDRTPDTPGLSHNINVVDNGISLQGLSSAFLVSAEFEALYGANPTVETFLTALYANVLDRAPDPVGFSGWNDLLESGQLTRADVLIGFSESLENIALVAPAIENGIWLGDGTPVTPIVDPVNVAPTSISISAAAVDENVADGTAVGSLSSAMGCVWRMARYSTSRPLPATPSRCGQLTAVGSRSTNPSRSQ
jgi:Ca2+-binding RTX toxin-like protein